MRDNTQTRLPLPKWCFVLLGVPTFYMPLAYLTLAVWVIGEVFAGGVVGPWAWMMQAIHPALYVTVGMWPIYIAWVGLSKRLAWREKGLWLFIVIFLNMVGMPMFYVFMIRRYLGLEERIGKRDETALDRFLRRHAIGRERLSAEQLIVLRAYCRKCRLTRLGIAPMIAVAALMLYTAVLFVPTSGVRSFADFAPPRVVFVDSATGSKKEIVPAPEALKCYTQSIMMLGAMAGVVGAMSIFILAQAISQLWGNGHRQALIEFLKATDGQRVTNPST